MDEVEGVDDETDRVKKKVEALEVQSTISNRKILQGARKTSMVIRGLAIASGNAMAEIYATGIEIALLTAELLIDVAAGEASTIVGAGKAALKIGIIISLFKKASQLQAGETEAAARTEGIVSALTAFTYMITPSPVIIFMIIRRITEWI